MLHDLSVIQSYTHRFSRFSIQSIAHLRLQATAVAGFGYACTCIYQGAAVACKHRCLLAQLSPAMLSSHTPMNLYPSQNGAHMLLQVSLYLLLMQERYGHVIESGLLWYLSHSSPQQVKLVPQELQSLMQARNWLAASLVPGQPLPPVIRDERACDKCFQKTVCALSHKVRFWKKIASVPFVHGQPLLQLSMMIGPATSAFRNWLWLP